MGGLFSGFQGIIAAIRVPSLILAATITSSIWAVTCVLAGETSPQLLTSYLPNASRIIIVNWLIKWHYDKDLRENRAKLMELKDEKRKVLEDIKNTENYRVAKELLDKFDNSDDETAEVNVPLVHEGYDPSMA